MKRIVSVFSVLLFAILWFPARADEPAAAAVPADAQPRLRVFVMDYVVAPQVPVDTATANGILTTRLDGLGFFDFISKTEVEQAINYEAMLQMLGTDDDGQKLVELGQAVNADRVVSGTLGKIGNTYVLNLTLMDVKNARVEKRWSRTVADTYGDAMIITGLKAEADSLLLYLTKTYKPGAARRARAKTSARKRMYAAAAWRQAGWGLMGGGIGLGLGTGLGHIAAGSDMPAWAWATGYSVAGVSFVTGLVVYLLAPEYPRTQQLNVAAAPVWTPTENGTAATGGVLTLGGVF